MYALSLSAAALAIAAAVVMTSPTAVAADLDYGRQSPERYGSAYDDPRYRDLYAPEPPGAYTYAPQPYEPPPYAQRWAGPPVGPVPPGYVYRDHDHRHHGVHDGRYADACLPRREIKQRLIDDGWHDFQDIEARGRTARLSARSADGELFFLQVDRCTGHFVRAERIERRGLGPYAYRGAPPRYERRYY